MTYYLLQDSDNEFALVSSDESADGWYPSLSQINTDLPYRYYFGTRQPLEAFTSGDQILLHTFTTRPTQADLLILFPEHYL